MRRLIVAVALVCAMAAPAAADLAAYERGDYVAALELLTSLAQAGDAEAQLRLGRMLYAGKGVEQDFVTAASWLQKAAEAGLGEAQNGLGRLYYGGEGVPQDFAEAARWYRSAAALGLAAAMDNLASLYLRGEGVPQDFAQATRWYLAGARKGRAEAQYNHGLMYYEGKGVPQDYAEALRWFRRAAAQRLGSAMSTIGEMYQLGRGVPANPVRAYAWRNLGTAVAPAAARVLAVVARDRAAAELSPEDLARGQRLAREIHATIGALAEGPSTPDETELALLTPGRDGPARPAATVSAQTQDEAALASRDTASSEVRAEPVSEPVAAAAPAETVTLAPIEDAPSVAAVSSAGPRVAATVEGPTLAPTEDPPARLATVVAPSEIVEASPPSERAQGETPVERALAPRSERAQAASEAKVAASEPAATPRPSGGTEAAVASLDAGIAAYRALDYWGAAHAWLPLARRGDPGAQRRIGLLYFDGTGVPSNPVQAYFWWTLAARQGDDEARSLLAEVGVREPDALVVARLLADGWTPAP